MAPESSCFRYSQPTYRFLDDDMRRIAMVAEAIANKWRARVDFYSLFDARFVVSSVPVTGKYCFAADFCCHGCFPRVKTCLSVSCRLWPLITVGFVKKKSEK